MKQTNNAIKFLMAQYRAIFKNANLKMFLAAATAAAAMAAGSAQAADALSTDAQWKALEGADKTVGAADSDFTKITIDADAAKFVNGKEFTLTIKGAEDNVIKGTVASAIVKAESGTIVLDGADASKTTLTIGGAGNSGAAVTLAAAKVLSGTLNINADNEKSSLTGGSIQIGKTPAPVTPDTPAVTADAATAKVVLGKNGSISTADTASSTFVINAGGELSFAADAVADKSKATAKNGIKLNGGTISVTNSGSGTIEGKIDVAGGSLVIGGDKNNTALTVNGNVTFTGEGGSVSIAKSGSLTVTSKTDNVALNLGNATVSNAGKVDFGTLAAKKSATLTVSADQYANLFTGSVEASGDATSKFNLKVVGDTEIDLDTILNDGALDTAKIKLTTAKLGKIQADKAKYDFNEIKTEGSLAFGTLTAGKTNALTLSGSSVVNVSQALNVNGGLESGVLTLNTATLNLNGTGAEHQVVAKEIKLEDGTAKDKAKLNILGGTWSVNSLNLVKGTSSIDSGASLVINGELTTTADEGIINVKNASTLDASAATKLVLASGAATKPTIDVAGGSTLELDQKAVFTVEGDAIKLTDGTGTAKHKVDAESIKTSADSVLKFNVDEGFTLNQKQLDSLITTLGGTKKQLAGFISFGDTFKLDGVSGESIELGKVTNADVYGGMTATTADGKVDHNVMIGNINVTTESGSVSVADNTTAVLYNADANGNFVSNKTGTTDVSLGNGANLTLAGNGKAGAIDGTAADQGNVTFGHSKTGETAGTVTVESIGATNGVASVTISRGDVVLTAAPETADAAVQLKTKELSLAKGTSLTAEKQDIIVTSAGGSGSEILGDVTAKSLTLTAGGTATTYTIAGEAAVDVDVLTLDKSGSLFVGQNNGATSSSATLEVGTLTLAGGSLIVDPAMTDNAAIAAVKDFSQKDVNGGAIVDGNIGVGMNSAVGIGFDTRAEVEQALTQANLMTDHKFNNEAKSVKGALILNKPITVKTGMGVVVDTSKTDAELKAALASGANKFQLLGNSALIISDSVYTRGADGKKSGVAVTMEGGVASSINADVGSGVILTGDFDANDTGALIFSGSAANAVSGPIDFMTANGVLHGQIGTDGKLGTVQVDTTKLDNSFLTVSAPVRDLLKDAVINQGGIIDKGQLGGKFLGQVANDIQDPSGVKADAAAHAATYAGAQQAAVAAVGTMAEAVGSRIGGLGVEATAIQATGSQANGGVWVTPMYKTVDADGFAAEGASYGADVDLAGVAFGTDTVNGNMRFGAVFNIGSGDADGKGNGNGLKDEFDYYGFGMYSVMGFGNFALVGDASLNVISHEVEGLGLKGEADTTAVTMGVTGQYTISNPMVDVTPHVGARFIRLDTDSYDLKSDKGILASTDFDVQNVFSVPLGVTLSKAFQMGGWSLAPSADLNITFNSGDTEVKSTTTFTGAYGIGLNTEVLDEVTYGVAVGLGAQYGAFGTAINVNYTGSENTDALGVNAQARYMF